MRFSVHNQVADTGLLGAWAATRWEYRSWPEEDQSADLICQLNGNITLSIGAQAWLLTVAIPGREVRTAEGSWTTYGDVLRLTSAPSEVQLLTYRLGAELLSLKTDDAGWDFNEDGVDERASMLAILVRL